jgi:hypothetical protein
VGDLIADEVAEEEIVPFLRIAIASEHSDHQRSLRFKRRISLRTTTAKTSCPLPVPKQKGTEESESKTLSP